MKYACIDRMRLDYPLAVFCRVLEVSRCGHLQHMARQRRRQEYPAQGQRISEEALLVHIRSIHAASRQCYGWPRIWVQLRVQGVRVGKERVRRLMRTRRHHPFHKRARTNRDIHCHCIASRQHLCTTSGIYPHRLCHRRLRHAQRNAGYYGNHLSCSTTGTARRSRHRAKHYPFTFGLMAILALLRLWYFKRRGWL